jgi:hypothetical protein
MLLFKFLSITGDAPVIQLNILDLAFLMHLLLKVNVDANLCPIVKIPIVHAAWAIFM